MKGDAQGQSQANLLIGSGHCAPTRTEVRDHARPAQDKSLEPSDKAGIRELGSCTVPRFPVRYRVRARQELSRASAPSQ